MLKLSELFHLAKNKQNLKTVVFCNTNQVQKLIKRLVFISFCGFMNEEDTQSRHSKHISLFISKLNVKLGHKLPHKNQGPNTKHIHTMGATTNNMNNKIITASSLNIIYEAPRGVCAPLIPENNALIFPNP